MLTAETELATLLQYDPPYQWRGGALRLVQSQDREVLLGGPAETGKSYAACYKAHMACREYPGAQGALVRKVAATIPGTILQTMKRIVGDFPVNYFGGENNPERIIYPNGSQIWIGGMDNPGKVLSGERDFIQVCQAEELSLNDWEVMTTRTTGRGATMPYTQIFGDCNPGGSKNYIINRKAIRLIPSFHRDNPALYDEQGNITEQGKRTMETLEALTGVRRKRLLEGLWVSAEGAVFENITVRKIADEEIAQFDRPLRGADWGYYPDPFSFGLMYYNASRRALYIYGEYRAYKQRPLQTFDELVKLGLIRTIEYDGIVSYPDLIVADSSEPGSIADYRSKGANIRGAEKGPDTVRRSMEWLQGLAEIVIDPDRAPGHAQEFSDCQYETMRNGEIVKEFSDRDNHSIDDTRYATNLLWRQGGV